MLNRLKSTTWKFTFITAFDLLNKRIDVSYTGWTAIMCLNVYAYEHACMFTNHVNAVTSEVGFMYKAWLSLYKMIHDCYYVLDV